MVIKINGGKYSFEDGILFSTVLEKFKINSQTVAAELNKQILPKKKYSETVLKEGDSIEIVTFVGGG